MGFKISRFNLSDPFTTIKQFSIKLPLLFSQMQFYIKANLKILVVFISFSHLFLSRKKDVNKISLSQFSI